MGMTHSPEPGLLRAAAGGSSSGSENENEACCRICLGSDDQGDMIAPCLCNGSMRWVHRSCLDDWRAQESRPQAFTHCPNCNFQYHTEMKVQTSSASCWSQWYFRWLVARDMGGLFLFMQLLIACLAKLIHLADPTEEIKKAFPKDWVTKHDAMMSIGPYYCCGAVAFFALLGIFGMIYMCCSGSCTGHTHRRRARGGGFLSQDTRDCILCCDVCDMATGGGAGDCFCCPCRACADAPCPECSSADGAGACGVVALVLVLIFAVLGVFVAIFFGTVVLQQIVQRHIHLLAKREEARRLVVRDFSRDGDLLAALVPSAPPLPEMMA